MCFRAGSELIGTRTGNKVSELPYSCLVKYMQKGCSLRCVYVAARASLCNATKIKAKRFLQDQPGASESKKKRRREVSAECSDKLQVEEVRRKGTPNVGWSWDPFLVIFPQRCKNWINESRERLLNDEMLGWAASSGQHIWGLAFDGETSG